MHAAKRRLQLLRQIQEIRLVIKQKPAQQGKSVQVLGRGHVRMAVWERGAGRTLACGTGACAAVVAGVLEGRTDRVCRFIGFILCSLLLLWIIIGAPIVIV